MSVETKYFCTGNCKAVVSQEEHGQGLVECGAQGCNMKGTTFEAGLFCTTCHKRIQDGTEEQHNH